MVKEFTACISQGNPHCQAFPPCIARRGARRSYTSIENTLTESMPLDSVLIHNLYTSSLPYTLSFLTGLLEKYYKLPDSWPLVFESFTLSGLKLFCCANQWMLLLGEWQKWPEILRGLLSSYSNVTAFQVPENLIQVFEKPARHSKQQDN